MNLLAMLPSVLNGTANVDELAKSLGLIKRTVQANELEGALLKLCENAVVPGMEVIEVTGVIGGKKIRCLLVAEPAQKKLVEG